MENRTITITTTAFKRYISTFLIYSTIGLFFLVIYVSLFPSLKDQNQNINEVIKSFPPEIMKAFNVEVFTANTIEAFLTSKHFSLLWPLMGAFMVIAYASYALAGEIEKGTMALFLSAPVSRLQVYVAKYIAGIMGIVLFVAVTALATIPLGQVFGIEVSVEKFLQFSAGGFLFCLAFFSVSYMISAFSSDRGRTSMISSMLLLFMYFANVISLLVDKLEPLKYLSFLHYFNANELLLREGLTIQTIIVFTAITIITSFVGGYWFNKRDIAV